MTVQPKINGGKKKTNEKHFFMVAAIAFYIKDEAAKQRHLNLLLELDHPAITSDVLGQVQEGLVKRVGDENQVDPTAVKDIVILGNSYLGHMTSEQFHGKK